MSEINASNFKKEHGDLAPDLVGVTELTSPYFFVPPSGTTAERPEDCDPGTLRFNTDIGTLEVFRGDTIGWEQIQRSENKYLGDGSTGTGTRAINAGGYDSPNSTNVNTIDYNTIEIQSNSVDFGDLVAATSRPGAVSDRTRYVNMGGSDPGTLNTIQFVSVSSTGNTSDFGDISASNVARAGYSANDRTRGVFGGGGTPQNTNVLHYITIQSTGNSVDYGDLTSEPGQYRMGNVASTTRGLLMGLYAPGGDSHANHNTIEFITIATLGNSQDFGDLTSTASNTASSSNSVRAIRLGKWPTNDMIDFVTIATLGDAIDFGDLAASVYDTTSAANSTRILQISGNGPVAPVYVTNTITFVEIATTGNSKDFGDVTQARRGLMSNSNGHGGL